MLKSKFSVLGSDVKLAYSLTFARACAISNGTPLTYWICDLLKTKKQPQIPNLLSAIFAGGIHSSENSMPFQQVLLLISASLRESVSHVLSIYSEIENNLVCRGELTGDSSSSTLFVKGSSRKLLIFQKIKNIRHISYDLKLVQNKLLITFLAPCLVTRTALRASLVIFNGLT